MLTAPLWHASGTLEFTASSCHASGTLCSISSTYCSREIPPLQEPTLYFGRRSMKRLFGLMLLAPEVATRIVVLALSPRDSLRY